LTQQTSGYATLRVSRFLWRIIFAAALLGVVPAVVRAADLAVPVVVWPTPAPMAHGTALGASQLNATANVPGSFVYTPPAGTVLNAGAGQILVVRFIPADQATYATVFASVLITVLHPPPSGGVVRATVTHAFTGTEHPAVPLVQARDSLMFGTTFAGPGNNFQVEFLTPNRGPDDHEGKPVRMPALGGAAALPLRFLDFLIYQPIRAVLLHGAGVSQVPTAAVFPESKLGAPRLTLIRADFRANSIRLLAVPVTEDETAIAQFR